MGAPLSREVLTQQDYQLSPSGYVLDNSSWQEEIHRRLEKIKKASPLAWKLDGGTVHVQSFELGSFEETLLPPAPEPEVEPTAEEIKAKLILAAESEARTIQETARKKALDITEQAHWEAQEILGQAKQQAEKEMDDQKELIKATSRVEGMAIGKEDGFKNGKEEGIKSFEASIQKWDRMAQELLVYRQGIIAELKPLLVRLLEESLLRCLRREAENHKLMAVEFAEEALRKAHDRVQLKLHVNPDDMEVLVAHRENLRLSIGSGPLELVADARVEKGGCLLETEAGTIDVRLATVAAQMKDSLNLSPNGPNAQ
jgi:flagellar assembly protein FliH